METIFATFNSHKVAAVTPPEDMLSASRDVIIPVLMRRGGRKSDTLNWPTRYSKMPRTIDHFFRGGVCGT
jgi:hypothetical protein